MIIATKSCITDHKDFVLQTIEDLGFVINYKKSELEPVTCIEFIGHLLDSCGPSGEPWIYATKTKLSKLKKDISRALEKGFIQARILAKITGQAIYVSRAILPGKLKLRSIYAVLRSRCSWADTLYIDNEARKDLMWWLSAIQEWNGSPLGQHPVEVQFTSDASDTGWGAAFGDQQTSGTWTPDL